jgi:ribonuclease Z
MTATTSVTITGTGVPHVAPGRAGPGVLVRSGDVALQFDAGRATTLRLAEAGTPPHALTALFLTHHHSDHMTGVVDVVFTRWLMSQGRHTPLPIVAPKGGAERYLSRMLEPWEEDIDVRMTHVGREDRPDPELVPFEVSAQGLQLVWDKEGVRVHAGAVHHEPVEPAVGYRIETDDGVVAISGDTRVCDELETLARGADVFVCEAFRRETLARFIDAIPQLEFISKYHADTVELGGLAERAGIGVLVLTHLIPTPSDADGVRGFEDDVRRGGYTGELIVAEDLTTVTLPSRRQA